LKQQLTHMIQCDKIKVLFAWLFWNLSCLESHLYLLFLSFFRLVTSAGWNDVLEPLLVTPPDCDMVRRNFFFNFITSYLLFNKESWWKVALFCSNKFSVVQPQRKLEQQKTFFESYFWLEDWQKKRSAKMGITKGFFPY